MAQESDLTELTDELYAGPPGEFVARRDALARQARSAGDGPLATRIRALRRPSVGAWYLNSAARERLGSLDELIRLGQELRDAQRRGDFGALRQLNARRGPLTSAALRELGAHLAGIGVTPTSTGLDEARATLTSALADPEVAEQLSRGRLDRPHVYAGFGAIPEVPPAAPAAETSGQRDADVERRAAEAAAARAERDAAEAELAARAAARRDAEARLRAADQRVETLTEELAQARATVRAAKQDLAAATDQHDAALRRVDRASRRLPEDSA